METRPLGITGLQVTPLGLGMAALGRPGYINLGHGTDLGLDKSIEAMEHHAHDVLDAAWAAGIRYYDTARSYGRGEAFLGSWLESRQIDPAWVTVGSKWGYIYTADWQISADHHEVKEHSKPVFVRQIKESRDLLNDYLNLYQIHSATMDSGVLDNAAVLDALAGLRDKGIVIGLSLSGPQQAVTLQQAMNVRRNGRPLFGAVQATWNLLSREAGPSLTLAHEAGMGVVIKEALANGRLTGRNDALDDTPVMNPLRELASDLDTTIDALSLAAVLAQPWVDCVLSGAATDDQLVSNVQALEVEWFDRHWEVLKKLAEPADQYWNTRSQLVWN